MPDLATFYDAMEVAYRGSLSTMRAYSDSIAESEALLSNAITGGMVRDVAAYVRSEGLDAEICPKLRRIAALLRETADLFEKDRRTFARMQHRLRKGDAPHAG